MTTVHELVRLSALALRSPAAARAVRYVRRRRLSYLPVAALVDLAERVVAAERHGVPGVLVEAGCALGGSALVMAAAKAPERRLAVFDTFGLIPPPGPRDGEDVHGRYATIEAGEATGLGGDTYYGYQPDLLATIRDSFADFGLAPETSKVELVAGLYQDTLHVEGPVAVAHIDCDWYDSVRVCLERLAPRLAPGGVLVIDDYEAWSGCREAVDEYFEERPQYRFDFRSRLHVTKDAVARTGVGPTLTPVAFDDASPVLEPGAGHGRAEES